MSFHSFSFLQFQLPSAHRMKATAQAALLSTTITRWTIRRDVGNESNRSSLLDLKSKKQISITRLRSGILTTTAAHQLIVWSLARARDTYECRFGTIRLSRRIPSLFNISSPSETVLSSLIVELSVYSSELRTTLSKAVKVCFC